MPERSRIAALLKLLDEPDEIAYEKIREQLVMAGSEIRPMLEAEQDNVFDPLVQERIRSVITTIDRGVLTNEFRDWIFSGDADLLKGFCLVAKSRYPGLKEEDIISRVEQLKVDIWIELHDNLTALEIVKVINHVLFHVHKFDGNKSDMSSPQNSFVNDLLDTRLGSPVSLGILYQVLANRLEIPIMGVNLPQHFILAYLSDWKISKPDENNVLFYINPFNQGAVFTRREIELFVRQMKIQPERSFFVPCSNQMIIMRLLGNLLFSYRKLGNSNGVEDIEALIKIFE